MMTCIWSQLFYRKKEQFSFPISTKTICHSALCLMLYIILKELNFVVTLPVALCVNPTPKLIGRSSVIVWVFLNVYHRILILNPDFPV